jgi:hypothetical protein
VAKQNDRLELKVVTPKGTAIYPKLNTPDTKFNAEGVYEVKSKFEPDAEDGVLGTKTTSWPEIIAAIDAQQDEFLKAKQAELMKGDGKAKKRAKEIESVEWGREADVDDEGNETSMIVVKAKMKASGTTKDGKPWKRAPSLFDAKSKKLPTDAPPIWGGSVLKIAGKVVPYYNAKDNVVGSTFYLEAVQVIELVSGQGREAGDYGFGEEDGYTTEERSQFAGDDNGEDPGNEGRGDF